MLIPDQKKGGSQSKYGGTRSEKLGPNVRLTVTFFESLPKLNYKTKYFYKNRRNFL